MSEENANVRCWRRDEDKTEICCTNIMPQPTCGFQSIVIRSTKSGSSFYFYFYDDGSCILTVYHGPCPLYFPSMALSVYFSLPGSNRSLFWMVVVLLPRDLLNYERKMGKSCVVMPRNV